jgi:RNA polymerase-binding transcription factor DksA
MPETTDQLLARLTTELAEANQQLAQYQTQAAQASADEVWVQDKMRHGLSRDQALNVIHRQRHHDQLAATAAKKL